MSYKDAVSKTIQTISKAALDARAELDHIHKARADNQQSLVSRIVEGHAPTPGGEGRHLHSPTRKGERGHDAVPLTR